MKKYLKNGYNLPIKGEASKELVVLKNPDLVSVSPKDFPSIKPKLLVKVSDNVNVGDALFRDKIQEKLVFTSPVSGIVKEIIFGERRSISEIIVEADKKEFTYKGFKKYKLEEIESIDREELLNLILETGLAPYFIQRPFGITPNFDIVPRDIFISAFFTQPLAPDVNVVIANKEDVFKAGINALGVLASGHVHLTIEAGVKKTPVFENLSKILLHKFKGKHPAGNVGVQIHHTTPITGKNDIVWTISLEGVINLGQLLLSGNLSMKKIICLAGEFVKEPKHYQVTSGQKIKEIVKDKLSCSESRIISGDVLTGIKKSEEDFLSFNACQISVIPEISKNELWGWMKLGLNILSFSKTYLSSLFKRKKYAFNTGMSGGERGLVQTGVYEKVVPMDILPNHLIKSILYKDYELMEDLGLLEVIPEDLALCEYVCVSKLEIQEILRKGLEAYQKEV